MSEDRVGLALLLSCSCCDCVVMYSALAAFLQGARGFHLTISFHSLSFDLQELLHGKILKFYFSKQSAGRSVHNGYFFFAVVLSGEDSAVLL